MPWHVSAANIPTNKTSQNQDKFYFFPHELQFLQISITANSMLTASVWGAENNGALASILSVFFSYICRRSFPWDGLKKKKKTLKLLLYVIFIPKLSYFLCIRGHVGHSQWHAQATVAKHGITAALSLAFHWEGNVNSIKMTPTFLGMEADRKSSKQSKQLGKKK